MKKLLAGTFLTLFALLLAVNVAFSQDTQAPTETSSPTPTLEIVPTETFDEAYKRYITEMEEYKIAHEEFEFKRAQYQRFGSLKSRQEAQAATVKLLAERDDVVIVFLEVLKVRVNEAIGVTQVRAESLSVRLNEEIGWFKDHKATIPSAGTLEDLTQDSNDARTRWNSLQPLIYEVLATTAHGRVLDFSDRTDEIFARVKNKIEEIRTEDREEFKFSSERFDVLDRWVFEVDSRIVRSKERRVVAEDTIALIARRKTTALNQYNEVLTILGETQLYLKEANEFMKEIVREIKTAEE